MDGLDRHGCLVGGLHKKPCTAYFVVGCNQMYKGVRGLYLTDCGPLSHFIMSFNLDDVKPVSYTHLTLPTKRIV